MYIAFRKDFEQQIRSGFFRAKNLNLKEIKKKTFDKLNIRHIYKLINCSKITSNLTRSYAGALNL